jgi:transcriptional regulator with XRE-family HTH domain
MASRPRGLGKSLGSAEHRAFCELLIRARKSAKLNQQQVAERLERPQSFVAKYERGERRLDVVEFVKVARALDADPVKLLRALIRDGV